MPQKRVSRKPKRSTGTTSKVGKGHAPTRVPDRPPAELPSLLALGMPYTEIAAKLKKDRIVVSKWAGEPTVMAAVQAIQAEAHQAATHRIRSLQASALQAVAGVLDTGTCEVCGRGGEASARDRLKAAEMVLDRTGMPRAVELTGGVAIAVTEPVDELEREVVAAVVEILIARALPDLAAALTAALGLGGPQPGAGARAVIEATSEAPGGP